MEIVLILIVILLIGAVAGGGYLLRDFGRQLLHRDVQASQDLARARAETEAERLTADLRLIVTEHQAGLARLRERQAELDAVIARGQEAERATRREAEDILGRLRRIGSELDDRLAQLTREHDDLVERKLSASPTLHSLPPGESASTFVALHLRRAETLGELYQRLSRVELAVMTLSNPILLPGEALSVPDELPPELLKWENWKDVGESAFAFGDYFNLHRHEFDDTTTREVESCLKVIRQTLTQAVYPNLAQYPTTDQLETLRDGLTQLGAIAELRRFLETQYQERVGLSETGSDSAQVGDDGRTRRKSANGTEFTDAEHVVVDADQRAR